MLWAFWLCSRTNSFSTAVGPQEPGPLPSSVPPPGPHAAEQRASVLVWTEVSSLRHFHGRRRGLPTFTRGNPLSDEGREISAVLLTHHNPRPHPLPTVVGHFVLAIAPSASMSNPLPLPSQEETSHAFPIQTPHSPKPLPKGFLLPGGCVPAMPQPFPHLPDVIQELGGREALLRAGKLLAVVLEEGQQVRVQVKQPATAREKPPSSHFLYLESSSPQEQPHQQHTRSPPQPPFPPIDSSPPAKDPEVPKSLSLGLFLCLYFSSPQLQLSDTCGWQLRTSPSSLEFLPAWPFSPKVLVVVSTLPIPPS